MLEDRVAIVTGGAGGIGTALVTGLLGAGAQVVAADVSGESLDRLASELTGFSGDARLQLAEVDVSDARACEKLVEDTVTQLGGVHVLVNNAAVGMGAVRADHMPKPVRISEVTPDTWRRLIEVNLSGAFYMTRAAVPHLSEQGWGRVINNTTSFYTMLRPGFYPYGTTKAGLEAFSAALAAELRESGVTVNVVVPGGPTDTPMVPPESGFDRATLIRPEAMTPPVLWLCSRAADSVTGNRYIAANWDADLEPDAAALACSAPIGWPELAQTRVWPAD